LLYTIGTPSAEFTVPVLGCVSIAHAADIPKAMRMEAHCRTYCLEVGIMCVSVSGGTA
jgi:hypothetical protein